MANLKTSLELDIKPFIDAINRAANSLKKIDDVNVKFNRSEFAKLEAALKRIPTVKNITTNVLGEAEAIRDLNQVEKNVKQIPNSKNINVNVDKNSSNRISQQIGGLTNQTSKLGTGLTGAFGGAAVGAAVAAFAYKSGRALISAGKTADQLGDSLDLAFSQAGFTGKELEQQVANAQKFSEKLANDFGVAQKESTLILARVTALTGITGKPAEDITKAVIGIEKASEGAITAQKAIQFFTKSLAGDPEAEAALNTLTAKFPELASVITSAGTAGEKAIAINEKLIGTFEALGRDAKTGFALFDIIGERLTLALGEGVNKSLDVFAPLLQSLSTGIGDLSGPIAQAFENLNASFLEPLVQIIQNFIQSFQALNTEGTATSIFFAILEAAGNALLFVFEALAEITLGVVEILQLFGPEVKFLTQLFVDAAKTGFAVALIQIKTLMQALVEVFNIARFALDGIYKGFEIVGDIISIFDSEIVDLIKNVDFFALYIDAAKKTLEGFSNIISSLVTILTIQLNTSLQNTFKFLEGFKGIFNDIINLFGRFGIETANVGTDFAKIGSAAISAIPGLKSLLGVFDAVSNAYQSFKQSLAAADPKNLSTIKGVGEGLLPQARGTGVLFTREANFLATESQKKMNKIITKPLGTGGGKTGTETALEKQLKAFKEITDFLDGKYSTGLKKINLLEQERNANSLIGLTALEKLQTKQEEINAQRIKQEEIEAEFLTAFKLRTKEGIAGLEELKKEYNLTTDDIANFGKGGGDISFLKDLAIKILPPKSTDEDVKNFLDEVKKVIDSGIETKIAKAAYQIELRDITLKLNKELIASDLDGIQTDLNLELSNISIGIPPTVGQDVFKELLNNVIKQSKEFSLAYTNKIIELQAEIAKANLELTKEQAILKKGGGFDSFSVEKVDNLEKAILKYTASLSELKNEQRDSINVENKAKESLNKIEEGYVNARLAAEEFKFRTVDAFQKVANAQLDKDLFKFEASLNVDGVSQGLIAIQKDFFKASKEIEISTQAFIKRLEIEAGGTTDAATVAQTQTAIAGVTKASEEQLKTLRIQREIAIREFNKQNDVVFALQEALSNNLANVISPDTTGAKSTLDKKKQDINSEVELLKAKLEIENQLNADNLEGRSLSYQEYTEKILDLEKEKNDAIKVYDDEVNAKRLESLQKIASETLPAINNAVLLSQNTLSDSLKQGTDSFTEQANKALEVIGVVAVQSLALAIQQSKTMEEIQKQFLKNVVAGLLKVLQAELIAAALQGLFEDVKKAGTLGLISGAILTATLGTLFAIAQAKINTIIDGFSEGGYTGNVNTNAVAGIVHGQEFVINADGTKRNRAALEYANNGGNLKDFFKSSSPEINTFVDTKNMSNSINGLANAMDSRLSSLETTVDKAIRQSSTTMRSQNSVDVSVYSDPGTTIKYMKKMGKIKGLS